ncbi:MAG: hypothetical protein JW740_02570 [Candidatus Zambryskibacteria bacterium]|nr:hypothetical protein [Candidatus Zambryskibacteria bacterium]
MKNQTAIFAGLVIFILLVANVGVLVIVDNTHPNISSGDWIAMAIICLVLDVFVFTTSMRRYLSLPRR